MLASIRFYLALLFAFIACHQLAMGLPVQVPNVKGIHLLGHYRDGHARHSTSSHSATTSASHAGHATFTQVNRRRPHRSTTKTKWTASPTTKHHHATSTPASTTSTTTKHRPTTTTTKKHKPTTTKKHKPTTTTTTKHKSTSTSTTKTAKPTSSSSSSSSGKSHSGDGTWYNPGLGSCGVTNSESDLIAALNYVDMKNGANPNNNPNCGRKINVTGPKGKVTVKIVDTCPVCKSGDVDLSPAAFAKIADLDQGRIGITWQWA